MPQLHPWVSALTSSSGMRTSCGFPGSLKKDWNFFLANSTSRINASSSRRTIPLARTESPPSGGQISKRALGQTRLPRPEGRRPAAPGAASAASTSCFSAAASW